MELIDELNPILFTQLLLRCYQIETEKASASINYQKAL